MNSFEFFQFDQTNVLYFMVSALGLLRERRILPFLILALGSLMYGDLTAALLTSLILWFRMDVSVPKWVQLKDSLGLFLIFIAAVAPAPIREFSICLGVFILSVSFGMGELGILPAILLLRQYIPYPIHVEVLLGGIAVYWVTSEFLRFTKNVREKLFRTAIEVVSSLGILFELQAQVLKWIDVPVLVTLSATILLVSIVIGSMLFWRKERFYSYSENLKLNISNTLTYCSRLISAKETRIEFAPIQRNLSIHENFDRVFLLALLNLILYGLFYVVSRGALT